MNEKESFIENEYVKIWLKDGVIIQTFKPHLEKITLTAARAIVQDRQKISEGVKSPLLVDANNVKSMDKEVRDYFVTEESIQDVSIAAFYMDNYITWLTGKLFLSFNKPSVKTELFRSKRKAFEWLKANKDHKYN